MLSALALTTLSGLSAAAFVQQEAPPEPPVTASPAAPVPVPPAAPPLRSGEVKCAMHDEKGEAFDLVAIFGKRKHSATGGLVPSMLLDAPESHGINGVYSGRIKPGISSFFNYVSETKTSVDVHFDVGYAGQGAVMIKRNTIGGSREHFVGTCTAFLVVGDRIIE